MGVLVIFWVRILNLKLVGMGGGFLCLRRLMLVDGGPVELYLLRYLYFLGFCWLFICIFPEEMLNEFHICCFFRFERLIHFKYAPKVIGLIAGEARRTPKTEARDRKSVV